ncbi:hypothetical protein [Streptomyces nanshensis]|uniref:Uncharacterized protein n=1 Tax=Streptomyces nanshensis TaxID=518642 RepID=A0A1E7KZP2_9ACTN|nr:hypothetical protein [Streptomyces nanshensis]OEV09273.1 hypothetical protein AN218_22745 [Streptomyces nanshensis]
MTTTRLTKRGRAFALEGIGDAATLETGGSMRRGKITVNGDTLPVEVNHPRRLGITVGDGKDPIMRLTPGQSQVPGSTQPAHWDVSRSFRGYRAVLTRGEARIEFSLPKLRGKSVDVSVTGEWAYLELVALAACFALLARRRGDTLRAVAVATASGPQGR